MPTRAFLFVLLVAASLAFTACGLLEQPEPPVQAALALEPSAVTVDPGATVQLQASLTAAELLPLSWRFEGGSLSANGRFATYSAPLKAGSYEITVSVPGEALAATSVVTVAEPHPLSPAITITPTHGDGTTLVSGASIELTAELGESLTGQSAAALVWEVSGGAIEAAGQHAVYTAPAEAGQYLISASIPGVDDAFGSLLVDVPGALLGPFTIVVVPDTQTLVRYSASRHLVVGMGQWIADNVEEHGIAFVTQLGDVVWHDREVQWTAAMAGLDLLDDAVPYSVSLGDHDYAIEEDKNSSAASFRSYFGPSRYVGYDWYGGAHEDGLSHYQVFEAGGREFLHLNLEWEPMGPASDPSTPLGWARSVLESHPHLPTFISTHAYLWDMPGQKGHFPDSAREGFFGDRDEPRVTTSGAGIFEALVKPFPQVLMVFNGHYHKDTAAGGSRGEYHQVSLNDDGLPVYEMLSNYQWMAHDDDPDWIRLVEFLPGEQGAKDRIEVTTFSPSREGTKDAYRDGPNSTFAFEVDLAERFAFD